MKKKGYVFLVVENHPPPSDFAFVKSLICDIVQKHTTSCTLKPPQHHELHEKKRTHKSPPYQGRRPIYLDKILEGKLDIVEGKFRHITGCQIGSIC